MLQSLHYFISLSRKFSQVAKSKNASSMSNIKTVLIDLYGTVHVDYVPVPGAIEALKRLSETDLTIKFITNASIESRHSLYENMTKAGFAIEMDAIYTSLMAVRDFLKKEHLKPMFLAENVTIDEDLPGFSDFDGDPDAVFIALSPSSFSRANLNKALRILLKGGVLVAAHRGKYYSKSDGLALGPGAFVRALEYASNTKAIVIGKPTADFFKGALDKVPAEQAVMIGDDIKDDIFGAQNLGIRGYLVKTGKYLKGDENKINPPPYKVVDTFADAVDDIISSLKINKL